MIASIKLDISTEDEEAIVNAMCSAFGNVAEGVGATDFAKWTPDQFTEAIRASYRVAAAAVFMKRIEITPPSTERVPGMEG